MKEKGWKKARLRWEAVVGKREEGNGAAVYTKVCLQLSNVEVVTNLSRSVLPRK